MESPLPPLRGRKGAPPRRTPGEGGKLADPDFGEAGQAPLLKCDGDEGLFCAYDKVEFLAPVYAGDYIEAYGEIEKIGNTSRTMKFEARKVIVARPDISASAADELDEPIVVCRASRHLRDPQGLPAQEDREVRERQKWKS